MSFQRNLEGPEKKEGSFIIYKRFLLVVLGRYKRANSKTVSVRERERERGAQSVLT